MAIRAFMSAIGPDFPRATYDYLVGISGGAFKFVYDSSESYEPLRDIHPVDVLARAAVTLGFNQAHWETNTSIETVKGIIKQEIDDGRPVIAPFLKPDTYHGFFIITGYDFDQDSLYLQGAFEGDGGYAAVPLPDTWDGPTASPAGWATNPIFVIGPRSGDYIQASKVGTRTLKEAIDVMRGGALIYGTHPGERPYMKRAGPDTAAYGMPAYDLLSADIENEKLVLDVDGKAVLNFGFIWRIDSQIGQLEHDRRGGVDFLRSLSTNVNPDEILSFREAVLMVEGTAGDARRLREFFWNEVPETLCETGRIHDYVRDSFSMVFRINDDPAVHDRLGQRGFNVFETPWGWVLVDDTREKRMLAKTAVHSIVVRERRSIRMFTDIIPAVSWRSSTDKVDRRTKQKERR
jgi:hypothetical protein